MVYVYYGDMIVRIDEYSTPHSVAHISAHYVSIISLTDEYSTPSGVVHSGIQYCKILIGIGKIYSFP